MTLILMLWVLSECSLTARFWLLYDLERWRSTALDKLGPNRRTNISTSWAPVGAKKFIIRNVMKILINALEMRCDDFQMVPQNYQYSNHESRILWNIQFISSYDS